MGQIKGRHVWSAVLLGVTILVYSPCLRGGFLWDDDAYISHNTALTHWEGLRDIWLHPGSVQQYYPVTFTLFWVQYHLWGLNPAGYHGVNVLLHGINAILFWGILDMLGIPGAWMAGWLFALHPVQTESVAWMTELKNVLSTFFYLLTLIFIFRSDRSQRSSFLFYGLAISSFVLALLSKSITVTLPVALLLIRWWITGPWDRKRFWSLVPFIGIGLGVGLFTLRYEHHWVGAQGDLWALNYGQRLIIAGRAFWFYLAKLFFPYPLVFIYPRWSIDSHHLSLFLYPGLAFAFLVLLAYGKRWWGKFPFACFLFFVLSVSPTLGFTPFYFMRYSFVADHFQYLASMGVFALMAWGITRVLKTLGTPLSTPLGRIVVVLIGINLALATAREAGKYLDSKRLWERTLVFNSGSAIAHHNLGIALSEQRQWKEAIAHLRTAEVLDPSFMQTHLALAFFAVQAKRWEDARHEYREAIRCGLRDPQILADFASLPAR